MLKNCLIAPEYSDRNGGYTQIFKIGPRRGDAAEMAIIRLIPAAVAAEPEKPAKKATAKKTSEKKPAAKKDDTSAVEAATAETAAPAAE